MSRLAHDLDGGFARRDQPTDTLVWRARVSRVFVLPDHSRGGDAPGKFCSLD